MNLLETIQEATKRGFEVSFFAYDGFLRVSVRTFVSASSFGFEIPEGYVEAVCVSETKICSKICDLMDEQDKVFKANNDGMKIIVVPQNGLNNE